MDSPALDRTEHLRALEGLRRINQASGIVREMRRRILAWAQGPIHKELRMLDVACGGGDVPAGVAAEIERAGIKVHLTLLDRSAVAVAAAVATGNAGGLRVRGVQGDATAGLPADDFDVVTNSLFLHHLQRDEVVRVLGHLGQAVKDGGLVVVSDLRRSPVGWLIAWAGCRLLSRSRVVHFDGPASVRAAWTVEELHAMAHEAGLTSARVERTWPWRMTLVWVRGSGQEGGAV